MINNNINSQAYRENNKTSFFSNISQENVEDNNAVLTNLIDSKNFSLFFLILYSLLVVYPQYDKNKNYYQEFWKIYLHNEIMIGEMKEHANEIKGIKGKISHTEVI